MREAGHYTSVKRSDPARPIAFSAAEGVALAVALLLLALHAVGAGSALEYRSADLASQPWRAFTGHFVHVNWAHAAINAAALLIVARLFAPDLSWQRQLAALILGALAISAVFALALPSIGWYRGLSGALHALFFAGAATWLLSARPRTVRALWLPIALFVGGWIKVVLEQPFGAPPPVADWLGVPVVTQAHLIGALCGTVLGALYAVAQPARVREQQKQEQR